MTHVGLSTKCIQRKRTASLAAVSDLRLRILSNKMAMVRCSTKVQGRKTGGSYNKSSLDHATSWLFCMGFSY